MLGKVNVPIQEVNGSLLHTKCVNLSIKREDKIHEKISGNKWRKLKYNLQFAKNNGFKQVITLGGAYSNHIVATAAAAQKHDLHSIGIIRGDQASPLNPSLTYANECGMKLIIIDRAQFKIIRETPSSYLKNNFPQAYFIPEGGTNALGIKGCLEIIEDLDINNFDYICCPIGTGGTISGIISGLKGNKKVLGFPALKGEFINTMIKGLLSKNLIPHTNFDIIPHYHFGGYAKFNTELIEFINAFLNENNIPLDPIYTGKMMYGIYDMIAKDYFPPKSKILAIHTGGLQGIAGFNQRFGSLIQQHRIT